MCVFNSHALLLVSRRNWLSRATKHFCVTSSPCDTTAVFLSVCLSVCLSVWQFSWPHYHFLLTAGTPARFTLFNPVGYLELWLVIGWDGHWQISNPTTRFEWNWESSELNCQWTPVLSSDVVAPSGGQAWQRSKQWSNSHVHIWTVGLHC